MQQVILVPVLAAQTLSIATNVRAHGHSVFIVASGPGSEAVLDASLERQDGYYFLDIAHLADPAQVAVAILRFCKIHKLEIAQWINLHDDFAHPLFIVSELLDLDFPFLRNYLVCRLKNLTREALSTSEADAVRFGVINRHDIDQAQFIPGDPMGLMLEGREIWPADTPFFAKPITGAGSNQVFGVKTREDFLRFTRSLESGEEAEAPVHMAGYDVANTFIIEDALPGDEWQFDGFVEFGKVRLCMSELKYYRRMAYGHWEMGGICYRPFSVDTMRHVDEAAEIWLERLMSVLEFDHGVFHIEAKRDESGRFRLIEFNPRPGGALVPQRVALLSGVDLFDAFTKSWLSMPVGQEIQATELRSILFIMTYPDQAGIVSKLRGQSAETLPYKSMGLTGEWYPKLAEGAVVPDMRYERYVGEFHFHNSGIQLEDVQDAVNLLFDHYEDQPPFIMTPL